MRTHTKWFIATALVLILGLTFACAAPRDEGTREEGKREDRKETEPPEGPEIRVIMIRNQPVGHAMHTLERLLDHEMLEEVRAHLATAENEPANAVVLVGPPDLVGRLADMLQELDGLTAERREIEQERMREMRERGEGPLGPPMGPEGMRDRGPRRPDMPMGPDRMREMMQQLERMRDMLRDLPPRRGFDRPAPEEMQRRRMREPDELERRRMLEREDMERQRMRERERMEDREREDREDAERRERMERREREEMEFRERGDRDWEDREEGERGDREDRDRGDRLRFGTEGFHLDDIEPIMPELKDLLEDLNRLQRELGRRGQPESLDPGGEAADESGFHI